MHVQSSRASGSAMLDSAPPSPADKIYSKPTQPGDDTLSLLGPSDPSTGNPALQGPGGKLLLAVGMLMQAVNIAESQSPGFVPDPVKQWIAMAMEQAPLMAEQMSRQGDPMAMLAAVGSAGLASGTSPMGMPAMNAGAPAGPVGSGRPPQM